MRDVILYMSMSLDGFIDSDREHPGMAIPEGAELKQWKLGRISKAGAHLMGRVTYQQMSSYWPQSANGRIALRVPPDVIKAKIAPCRRRGKPWHRNRLQNLDDYDIVRIYGVEYRGIVNYYLLAQDVWRLSVLCWYAQTSMLKTLAAKHKSSVAKTAARYKAKVITGHGPRTCFEARRHREGKKDLVARFGGIPLRQDRRAVIHDPAPAQIGHPRKELINRLLKRACELCEHGTTVAVHQVTALKQLGKPGPGQPAWAALMAKMRRKTLIVCADCHAWIHANPVAHAA